jgi:hypothetical protein
MKKRAKVTRKNCKNENSQKAQEARRRRGEKT